MRRLPLCAAITLLFCVVGCSQPPVPSAPVETSAAPKNDALANMQIVFDGNHSREEIKTQIDKAMRLYNVPISEENYNRYGGMLLKLKEKSGVPEMDVLSYMIRNHVDHVKMSFPDMAALSAGFIKAGDK